MTTNNSPRYSTAIRHRAHTDGFDAAVKMAMQLLSITEAEAVYHVRSCQASRQDVTHYEWSEKQ